MVDELSHPDCTVAIIGGGPAGMGCALWLKQLGCRPTIIERQPELGGQLRHIERVNRWVLGKQDQTSVELARDYAAHIRAEGIETVLGARLVGLTSSRDAWELMLQAHSGRRAAARFARIVVATGTRPRTHEAFGAVPGFEATRAAGLISFWPLDHLDRPAEWREKPIAVIGGGDNAHFTAADLAEVAGRVHLVMRSEPTAQRSIRTKVQALIASGRIIEHVGVAISGFIPGPGAVRIDALNGPMGPLSIDVDRIFARVGFIPNTEFLAAHGPLAGLQRDAAGYLVVDAGQRTSLGGVYAIGDVANPSDQAVVLSVADGAVAARAIVRDLIVRRE